jgi:hypothetical protein
MARSPEGILQKLVETALTLCRAHSAGLSLLEAADQKRNFHWRAVAGQWAPHLGGGTPRDFGPCGTVLDRNASQVFAHPELDFPYFAEVTPYVEEGLLIPFYIGGEAVGTIWVISHDKSHRRKFRRGGLPKLAKPEGAGEGQRRIAAIRPDAAAVRFHRRVV